VQPRPGIGDGRGRVLTFSRLAQTVAKHRDRQRSCDFDEAEARPAPERPAIKALEDQHSFPKVNALFRGRYWPSMKSWLNRYNGIGNDVFATQAEDGEENFDKAPSEK
jgi:hypothetical protein